MIDSAGQRGKPAAWDGSFGGTVPDWATLDVELKCPRCAYNLRMLTRPRCPECGFIFDWDRLIAAARDRSISPLFEIQWRTRPVRSLLMTYLRALWPWWIWRNVPIESTPALKPLAIAAGILLLLHSISVAFADLSFANTFRGWRLADVKSIEWLPLRAAMLLAGSGLFATLLFMFRWTYSRFNVRRSQVWRVVFYAWLSLIVWKIAARLTSGAVHLAVYDFGILPIELDEAAGLLLFILDGIGVLFALVSAIVGLQRALQLRRGAEIVVSAALITLISGFVITLLITTHIYGAEWNKFEVLVLDSFPSVSWVVRELALWSS